MLTISVQPKVEAGTDRGGEDLLIVFTATTKKRPKLPNPEFRIAPLSEVRDWGNDCIIEALEREGETNIKRVLYRTPAYEFTWEGTREDLAKIVKDALNQPENWDRPLNKEIYRFRYEHFVDGNAD